MKPLTMAKVEASLPLLAKEGCLTNNKLLNERPHNLPYGQEGPTTR